MKAQCHKIRRIAHPNDPEHTALFFEFVVVKRMGKRELCDRQDERSDSVMSK